MNEALQKVKEFILFDEGSNFDEKLVLLRLMQDMVDEKIRTNGDLFIILLRLKYKSPQSFPESWRKLIAVPDELSMESGTNIENTGNKMENFPF